MDLYLVSVVATEYAHRLRVIELPEVKRGSGLSPQRWMPEKRFPMGITFSAVGPPLVPSLTRRLHHRSKSITRSRAALDTARECEKPVIILKSGRSEAGAQAVASHTAALVGSDEVYDALFHQYNVYRAHSIGELLNVAYACTSRNFPSGNRVGLLTASGGIGILMADRAVELGLDVAPLPATAQEKLRMLWPPAAVGNPIDTTAQVSNDPTLLAKFLEVVLEEGNYEILVIFLTYLGMAQPWADNIVAALKTVRKKYPGRHMLVSMLAAPEIREELETEDILVLEEPTDAVAASAALASFRRGFEQFKAPKTVETSQPLAVTRSTFPEYAINEYDAKLLLRRAGIPIIEEQLVHSAEEAERAAYEIGFPVALKIASTEIQHKTEVGGVMLDLNSSQAVTDSYLEIAKRASSDVPEAQINGVLVAPMVKAGIETILGVDNDPVFGPVVMFGLGGTFVEVLRDVTHRLAPFEENEARNMIREVQGYPLLEGVRGQHPYDIGALARALAQLSAFAFENADRVGSIDINPFIVFQEGQGAVAVDALILPKVAKYRESRFGGRL